MLLDLPSVTNCHTSDPSPSSMTYFMDGPCLQLFPSRKSCRHCRIILV